VSSEKLYQYTFQAMGSPCDLQWYSKDKECSERIARLVIEDVRRLEARYSRYRSDSWLTTINQVGRISGEIEVDAETASLLNYAATCYQQSEALFDITSGLLRQIWHFRADQQLPNPEELQAILAKIGWEKLIWKPPLLRFTVAGMELDFGGIVKEYAVDRAAALAKQAGIDHGVINLGGDIKVIGCRLDGQPWRIGIRHPRQTESIIQTICLTEGALASSGDYERGFSLNGKRYSHILNPKTGYPVSYLAAVSVISEFCVVAGSASTIAMLKEQQGIKWLQELGLVHFWVDLQGHQGGNVELPSN
jgi:thiamine biosynthesis lipoprotein